MITRQVRLLVLSCMGMTLLGSGQTPNNGEPAVPMGYELYSWQESSGRWSFSLLPSPSGVNVPLEEVFNKKFVLAGPTELKRKISSLPAGTTIYWLNRTSGTDQRSEGSKKLRYPSAQTIQDIRHYAEARGIKVELLSGEQDGTDHRR